MINLRAFSDVSLTCLQSLSAYLRYISGAFPRTLTHCTLNSVTVQFHTAPARAPPLFVCLLLVLMLLLFVCLIHFSFCQLMESRCRWDKSSVSNPPLGSYFDIPNGSIKHPLNPLILWLEKLAKKSSNQLAISFLVNSHYETSVQNSGLLS